MLNKEIGQQSPLNPDVALKREIAQTGLPEEDQKFAFKEMRDGFIDHSWLQIPSFIKEYRRRIPVAMHELRHKIVLVGGGGTFNRLSVKPMGNILGFVEGRVDRTLPPEEQVIEDIAWAKASTIGSEEYHPHGFGSDEAQAKRSATIYSHWYTGGKKSVSELLDRGFQRARNRVGMIPTSVFRSESRREAKLSLGFAA